METLFFKTVAFVKAKNGQKLFYMAYEAFHEGFKSLGKNLN